MTEQTLPSALSALPELAEDWYGKRVVIFVDYDGTLTPIVSRPDQAVLSESMRMALQRLARQTTVAVLSGRDRTSAEKMVGLPELYYAGSHGFDISGPDGFTHENEQGVAVRPALKQAADEIEEAIKTISGAWVDRKRFAIAIHNRQVRDAWLPDLEKAIGEIAARYPQLRLTGGKRVFELRPDIDWHKGTALRWLLKALKLDGPDVVPMFLGDDETDEDAFIEVEKDGVGIRVGHDDAPTRARYMLRDTDEARRFLERMNGVLGRPM
jgi:alpha,alpha-trehalase